MSQAKPSIPARNKYRFGEIKVGEYKKLSYSTAADANRARTAAHMYTQLKADGTKFITQVKSNQGFFEVELWRVEK